MFLCAVARPRYVHATNKWWDGKLGIWPFVASVEAQRDSVNRPAGTLETKSISVTNDVYRTVLLDKVLPSIVAMWPCEDRVIKHQNDTRPAARDAIRRAAPNGPGQVCGDGMDHTAGAAARPTPMSLTLDFAAMQYLQHRTSSRTIDELVGYVTSSFDEYPHERLNHTFMSLLACLIETMIRFETTPTSCLTCRKRSMSERECYH
ncbi:hypothetical protein AaE_001382 [Aphanomyces astaci]|uniref:Uncharacterized protein n=1 Tax=Aphanomyces astaci TaxID=112090 RepID=A0A6A5ACL8_APHAT|nr:hypothetical protein AaE_001382 [Aphanomyces astaci]